MKNYEISKILGRGKFAVVFMVASKATGGAFALKAYNQASLEAGSTSRRRVLDEVRLLQSLEHPNIVKHVETFWWSEEEEDDDEEEEVGGPEKEKQQSRKKLCMVLEYADGGDLKKLLRRHYQSEIHLSEDTIVMFFVQLCRAVRYLHERRVMHRDLKPANLLLFLDGTLKLTDFSYGRRFTESTSRSETTTTERQEEEEEEEDELISYSRVGTPIYMAPEVFRTNGYGFSSDIWGMGCILYEMMALRNPFQDNHSRERRRLRSHNRPQHASGGDPSASATGGTTPPAPSSALQLDELPDGDLVDLVHRISRADYVPIPSHLPYSLALRNTVKSILVPNVASRPSVDTLCAVIEALLSAYVIAAAATGSSSPSSSRSPRMAAAAATAEAVSQLPTGKRPTSPPLSQRHEVLEPCDVTNAKEENDETQNGTPRTLVRRARLIQSQLSPLARYSQTIPQLGSGIPPPRHPLKSPSSAPVLAPTTHRYEIGNGPNPMTTTAATFTLGGVEGRTRGFTDGNASPSSGSPLLAGKGGGSLTRASSLHHHPHPPASSPYHRYRTSPGGGAFRPSPPTSPHPGVPNVRERRFSSNALLPSPPGSGTALSPVVSHHRRIYSQSEVSSLTTAEVPRRILGENGRVQERDDANKTVRRGSNLKKKSSSASSSSAENEELHAQIQRPELTNAGEATSKGGVVEAPPTPTTPLNGDFVQKTSPPRDGGAAEQNSRDKVRGFPRLSITTDKKVWNAESSPSTNSSPAPAAGAAVSTLTVGNGEANGGAHPLSRSYPTAPAVASASSPASSSTPLTEWKRAAHANVARNGGNPFATKKASPNSPSVVPQIAAGDNSLLSSPFASSSSEGSSTLSSPLAHPPVEVNDSGKVVFSLWSRRSSISTSTERQQLYASSEASISSSTASATHSGESAPTPLELRVVTSQAPDMKENSLTVTTTTVTTANVTTAQESQPSDVILGDLIGEGSFAKVYRAVDAGTGAIFAAKVLQTAEDDEESTVAMEREIALLTSLRHPNLVRYLGTGRHRGSLAVYLEYCKGGSIAQMVKQFRSFPERLIRVYTRQILDALGYLHARGIVHLDLKGGNVLVDGRESRGVAKLADFGCSVRLGQRVRSVKGTVHWMAPEVAAMRVSAIGTHSDVWSLGATVVEMATGNPPWREELGNCEPVAALVRIATATAPPAFPTSLYESGRAFMGRCMTIDPKARWTAKQLALHEFLALDPVPGTAMLVGADRSRVTVGASSSSATTLGILASPTGRLARAAPPPPLLSPSSAMLGGSGGSLLVLEPRTPTFVSDAAARGRDFRLEQDDAFYRSAGACAREVTALMGRALGGGPSISKEEWERVLLMDVETKVPETFRTREGDQSQRSTRGVENTTKAFGELTSRSASEGWTLVEASVSRELIDVQSRLAMWTWKVERMKGENSARECVSGTASATFSVVRSAAIKTLEVLLLID